MDAQRLDKLIASTGKWSRREAKLLIKEGRVLVDGTPARSGEDKADPSISEILVDGENLGYRQYTYIMLNKPAGVLSATEDRRQKTVLDLLPEELRRQDLFPVGRLDRDTAVGAGGPGRVCGWDHPGGRVLLYAGRTTASG